MNTVNKIKMCAVKLYMYFKNIVLFEASVSVNYQTINIKCRS